MHMIFNERCAGRVLQRLSKALRGWAPWLLLSCAAVCLRVPAQALPLNNGFEDEEKPWQEVGAQLPPLPADGDLLPFDVSASATQRFAVDGKSISVGSDGVVRFTLVTSSRDGAKNVSFEGIRCATRERKIYALGHGDGTWSQARRSEWHPIVYNAANRQEAALAQEYFCSNTTVAGNATDMARRLQRHESLTQDLTR
ncbi:MAG: hypothetical protein NVSMB6_19780 [Burkholderiaceae bacterium]